VKGLSIPEDLAHFSAADCDNAFGLVGFGLERASLSGAAIVLSEWKCWEVERRWEEELGR